MLPKSPPIVHGRSWRASLTSMANRARDHRRDRRLGVASYRGSPARSTRQSDVRASAATWRRATDTTRIGRAAATVVEEATGWKDARAETRGTGALAVPTAFVRTRRRGGGSAATFGAEIPTARAGSGTVTRATDAACGRDDGVAARNRSTIAPAATTRATRSLTRRETALCSVSPGPRRTVRVHPQAGMSLRWGCPAV